MPKQIRVILAIIVLAALVGAGWHYTHTDHASVSQELVLYGNVDIREVRLAFNDTGRITGVLAQEGAVVKPGELLATLDDTRYAASLDQAKAEMQGQKQGLAKLLAGSRPEEIAEAKAAMNAARVTYLNDEVNYQRYAHLVSTSAATRQQRDDAKAAFEAARERYDAANQAYLLAVKGPRTEDIAAARAAYQASVAAVALAQRAFDDTKLYAPSAGVVEERILQPGDMASPSTPVFTIALPDPLWVRTYVPENRLGRIRPGMTATISTDSYPGRTYKGWIGYISPTAEFTPKTVETPELRTALVYQLRVYVCDSRGELRLGMPATVHVDLLQPSDAKAPAGCGGDNAGAG